MCVEIIQVEFSILVEDDWRISSFTSKMLALWDEVIVTIQKQIFNVIIESDS